MKKQLKNNKGITLIALVITIIVLLILAGVSIAMLTGESGIITKANIAAKQTNEANTIEKINVAIAGSFDSNGKLDLEELIKNIKNTEGQINVGTEFPLEVTVDGMKVEITTSGNIIKAEGGKWNGSINSPRLMEDMTPIYWDDNANEVETTYDDNNWYNYEEGKWANAKTSDGSYFVWIPRYAYKITGGLYTKEAGTIEVKFIDTNNSDGSKTYSTTYPSVTGDSMDDYVVHPAFVDGTSNDYSNGEWDCNLSGIWVAKFEMSMEVNGIATKTTDETIGNVTTNDSIKAVSKPGVTAWRYTSPSDSYTNSYNYNRRKESHLLKNSEWGAIAYLTHSKYGKNGTEVTINDNSEFYTGGGEGESFKSNIDQSTTGNITGVYDASGGSLEVVAGYIRNGTQYLKYGSSFVSSNKSTKYATIYPYDTSEDTTFANYNKYKESANTRFGDSILETSISAGSYTSWFEDTSSYYYDNGPFMTRGGRITYGNRAGVFAFVCSSGTLPFYNSFRTCLAF